MQAVIHDLPSFVSSFDYSLVSHTFLQQPAAAGRTAHLDTLSIQHTAEALQIHGCSLLDQAQEAVTKLVIGHMQELCEVLSQQEVVTVLKAAHAAIRASADAEGQGLAALQQQDQSQQQQDQSQASDSTRRDTDAGKRTCAQDAASSSCGSSDTHRLWLENLSDAQLVEHAEMVQAGLQQQQVADAHQSCLDCIAGLLTGASAESFPFCHYVLPECEIARHLRCLTCHAFLIRHPSTSHILLLTGLAGKLTEHCHRPIGDFNCGMNCLPSKLTISYIL